MYDLIGAAMVIALETGSVQTNNLDKTTSIPSEVQEPHLQTIILASPQPTVPATEKNTPATPPTDSPDVLRFPIKEFRLQGNTLLSNEDLQDILKSYLGEDRTLSDLTAARDALIEAYRKAGYSLLTVSLPQRQTLEGVFQIDITEVRVSKVTVTGNRHFNEDSIRAALPELQQNRTPKIDQLAQQLFLANDNPSRQLTLDFQPGEQGQTNVEIKVQDENPQRWMVRLDNTGTEATGRSRFSAISQNSNLFNRGHLAAFSVTVSPEKINRVLQLGLFYQAPIPQWGDAVNFRASYSDVNSGRVADVFDVSGQGFATGIHYLHNISRTALDRQTLDIGLDYRLFENTVDFFGENLGVDVASFPVSVRYQYAARRGNNAFSAGVGYVRNIPGLVGRNDNETYRESRAGADADWDLFEVNGAYQYTFPSGWLLNIQGEGQYAGEPLISGEQFGLGGVRSLRGLEEREVAGDNALRASLEVYTPAIANSHRFLAFTDIGQYWRENTLPGEPDQDFIWTVGLGWRWNFQNRLSAAVDLGYVLDGAFFSDSGDVRGHFSVNYSF